MKEASVLQLQPKIHTRSEALVFRVKAFLLQSRRGAENLFDSGVKSFPKTFELANQPIVGESKTALWTEKDRAEMPLMAGKIHNLRLAIANLNGAEISANQTFSFWKQTGRATRRRGFVRGRELREGCVIPNVGGGLCQLSNALYDAALQANFEIVERHAHTQIVPGSLAEKGRDATVFWNYVDLRFRSSHAFRIEAELTATHLIVRFRS
ncbi:MAG TPA: VanW family protein, partial [Pyrinomonadaceae bacterium]|nr:VanW family protein [Pyrinomonadaceae bacterium]